MSNTVRLLTFSEGVVTTAPTLTKMASTGFIVATDDANYAALKGSAVATGDAYYSSSTNSIRYRTATAWVNLGGIDADTVSTQAVASDGTITLDYHYIQSIIVSGSGGPQTASTTPFGTSPTWSDGTEIKLIGGDDTNTLTLAHNDAANGLILNGPCVLEKYMHITFKYFASLGRYVETGRNF